MGATTPNKHDRFRKNEDCFSPSVFDMNEEFDFEKNLAMFDKEGVMAEIDQECVFLFIKIILLFWYLKNYLQIFFFHII